VDRLRRRLLTAKKAKTAGMRLATGKTQLEKSKGVRGGKMGGAFRVLFRGLSVIVQNSAKYSAVHNRGGRVGNGAILPAWEFMFISAKAKADLAEIALNWLLRGKKQ
jgi:phage gpG-like protein